MTKAKKAPKCLICGSEDPDRFTMVATKSMCMDCRNAYRWIQRGSGDAGKKEDRRVYAYYRKMGRELAEDPKLEERNRMVTEKLEEAERLRADFDERFKVMEIGLGRSKGTCWNLGTKARRPQGSRS